MLKLLFYIPNPKKVSYILPFHVLFIVALFNITSGHRCSLSYPTFYSYGDERRHRVKKTYTYVLNPISSERYTTLLRRLTNLRAWVRAREKVFAQFLFPLILLHIENFE